MTAARIPDPHEAKGFPRPIAKAPHASNSDQPISPTTPASLSADRPNSNSSVPIPGPANHAIRGMLLFDPLLATLAAGLDDVEKTKNQQANRYRQLTRTETDKDGTRRGFGLDDNHPGVAALGAQVDALEKLNAAMTKALEKQMKSHPLYPWVEANKGLGAKTVARLLHAIRDPYWNDLHDRPRTVSELWAFCGLHVLPAGQTGTDESPRRHGVQSSDAGGFQQATGQNRPETQKIAVGGSNSAGGDTGLHTRAAQNMPAGIAPRRTRGQKANWSTDAKTRCYLIAESMLKNRSSAYRHVYDEGREKYAEAIHAAPCRPCSALPGSPLKDGHKHARAMRLVMKAILRDLWLESKAIYETTVKDNC